MVQYCTGGVQNVLVLSRTLVAGSPVTVSHHCVLGSATRKLQLLYLVVDVLMDIIYKDRVSIINLFWCYHALHSYCALMRCVLLSYVV